MRFSRVILSSLACLTSVAFGQGLDPATLLKPPTGSWLTYNGDYSGRRFSSLDQINANNVQNLKLAWVYQANSGGGFGARIASTPLLLDGVLYFTMPDHAWAVDARTGREIWHYKWESQGGIHTGNRGVAIYHDWLFFETPDDHLISLEKDTGKFRWAVEIADLAQEYFATPAPLVIGNHVIVGVGGDSLDVPGFLESRDPEDGKIQWHWNSEPRKGEPGSETWPNEQAMSHGGGMTWITGTYDPELNLLYWGTGNPNPVHAAQGRKGDNLWTCSIVALNPNTGKLVWWFQASPHDTHDWDNVETPVLFDGEIDGKPRKLLGQAARNGYFFVLDRTDGKSVTTAPFVDINWSTGVGKNGEPIPNPGKEPKTDGALVIPASGGATNWYPPSFSPQTGLFYVSASPSYSVYYLTDTSKEPQGYGGRDSGVWSEAQVKAIDYKTGKIRWSHAYPGSGAMAGILTTAGHLLFTGDPSSNAIAFDPENGHILWHAGLTSPVSNGPMTYLLDGRQYIIVGAGELLYAFTLPNDQLRAAK
ncbi:MAG: acido-empty-quinoprotein group A [Acidobacteriota bacterium]|nr:acido-empty-quinoprotein group A [Acidobacteriota bacterium]